MVLGAIRGTEGWDVIGVLGLIALFVVIFALIVVALRVTGDR
ncbi:MAG: hypothetical protein R3290_01125 [Acidimicrobiia bacterium]|nr:hypothetical protein [Acidimicrobiia bacterium]